jgi:hypothetical protein
MILPVQAATGGAGLPWASDGMAPARAQLDSTLERLIRERGLASSWALASDLVRTARRNPDHATSPTEIRAGYAVRLLERRRDADIPEPMASQLRMLGGFHDARYALVPVEVQYAAGTASGTGHAVLRVAVLDLRGSRLVFIGDIVGPDGPASMDAANAGVAGRFVDLIVP